MKNRKIKILHMRSATGNGGGPEKTILNSPRYIDNRQFDMSILYLKKANDPDFSIDRKAKMLNVNGFYSIKEKSQFDKKAMQKTADLIRNLDIDILHTHDYKTDWWGWLLKKKSHPVKLITTVHGWTVMNSFRERMYYQAGKLPLYFFDRILAVNDEIVTALRKIGVSRRKIETVYNAIDTEEFSFKEPENGNDTAAKPVIGFIGRLSREKCVPDLITAYSKLSVKYKIGKLLIAGEGPDIADLKQQVRDMGLEKSVEFLGFTDSRHFFRQTDIFVNPSLKEGLPNTILEGMAVGTAVVATAAGATGVLIKDKQTGLIIPPEAPEKIYNALEFLIRNPRKRSGLVKTARALVCDKFDFSNRMRIIERIYRELYNGKHSG